MLYLYVRTYTCTDTVLQYVHVYYVRTYHGTMEHVYHGTTRVRTTVYGHTQCTMVPLVWPYSVPYGTYTVYVHVHMYHLVLVSTDMSPLRGPAIGMAITPATAEQAHVGRYACAEYG